MIFLKIGGQIKGLEEVLQNRLPEPRQASIYELRKLLLHSFNART